MPDFANLAEIFWEKNLGHHENNFLEVKLISAYFAESQRIFAVLIP